MKVLAIVTAATLAMCSASLAAPQTKHTQVTHPKTQTVNTNVKHNIPTRPVPPHHTVHQTSQQRHDSAARMMQPIR
jgi:hypothetical protein